MAVGALGPVAGITTNYTFNNARWYLTGGDILFVFICGLVTDEDSSAKVVPVNDADNRLHPGLAVAMIALGPH